MKRSNSRNLTLAPFVLVAVICLLGAHAANTSTAQTVPEIKGTGTWNEESEEDPPEDPEEGEGDEDGGQERVIRLHIQGPINEEWAQTLKKALGKKDATSKEIITKKIESLATINIGKDGPALKLIAAGYYPNASTNWRIRIYRDVKLYPKLDPQHYFELSLRATVSRDDYPKVVAYLHSRVNIDGAKEAIIAAFKNDAAAASVISRDEQLPASPPR